MRSGDIKNIPADFPREDVRGSLAGFQPKIGVRLIDGKFFSSLTEDELYARYDACEDLVLQLIGYCDRKRRERPAWDLPTLLTKLRGGVAAKGWDLSPAEFEWVMTEVSQRMPGRSSTG